MICYKDKTFCTQSTCANWNKCDRALTEEVQAKAEAWWMSTKPPIATFVDRPDCYKSKDS